MVDRVCWYIVKGEQVIAVSTAEPCAVDAASRGETIIKSNRYETDLPLIKSVDSAGRVLLKTMVTGQLEQVAADLLRVRIRSETFTGRVKLKVLDMIVDAGVGEVLEIETLPNYPVTVSFEPSSEYIGIIRGCS